MRRKHWLKDLSIAASFHDCTGLAVCFSRPWVPRRRKLRLRSAKPSESQKSRSRFRWRNAQKQPTRNTVAKKRAGQEDVDSDYPFGSFSQLPAFRSTNNKANGRTHSGEAVFASRFGDKLAQWALAYSTTRNSENTSKPRKGTPELAAILMPRHINAPAGYWPQQSRG